jgi:hypothetical protein
MKLWTTMKGSDTPAGDSSACILIISFIIHQEDRGPALRVFVYPKVLVMMMIECSSR